MAVLTMSDVQEHTHTLMMCGSRFDQSHLCQKVVIYHTEIIPKALILTQKLHKALYYFFQEKKPHPKHNFTIFELNFQVFANLILPL